MKMASGGSYRNIPTFVSLDPELHPLASHLFAILAFQIDLETNRVEMSIEELAVKARISPGEVQRHLPALEAKGYIEVERTGKGKKARHVFHIAGPAALIVLDQVGPSEG